MKIWKSRKSNNTWFRKLRRKVERLRKQQITYIKIKAYLESEEIISFKVIRKDDWKFVKSIWIRNNDKRIVYLNLIFFQFYPDIQDLISSMALSSAFLQAENAATQLGNIKMLVMRMSDLLFLDPVDLLGLSWALPIAFRGLHFFYLWIW